MPAQPVIDDVPRFIYGTAWKEEQTERLTTAAIQSGFRALDTANQRRHYHEAGVGAAIVAAAMPREALFLQTKFTFRAGQDHRLPYDPTAAVSTQVEQSFASSLEHLQTTWLDSYVLHGPSQADGLGEADDQAWRAMEAICARGGCRWLGVSNVSLAQLQQLVAGAQIKPRFVQNRCFALTGWDYHVRRYCRAQGIYYQGFSLLTANRPIFVDPRLRQIAERHGRTLPQIVFRFALEIGMIPLTGTTSAEHLREDLAIDTFTLSADEVSTIETLALRG